MPKHDKEIYDPKFVSELFNKMSASYGITNYISSFGFTESWRKQCIGQIKKDFNNKLIIDMMSGMGEIWHSIEATNLTIMAVDISPVMNQRAKLKAIKSPYNIKVIEDDILENSLSVDSADIIVSSFGLKTFNNEQLKRLAKETYRLLKPGGEFSFIEISEPNNLLRIPYTFYLKVVIPIIGFLFMGNDNSYRFLGKYCSNFQNSRNFYEFLKEEGLEVHYNSFFKGCATGVSGNKPTH